MHPPFLLLSMFLTPKFFLRSIVWAFLFVLFALLLLNFKSYASFLGADYSLLSRLNILFLITIGSFSAITFLDALFLFLTAFLFGVNTELVIEKIRILKKSGSLKLTFGAGIVSLAATGCASCGLSLASIAGLTGVIVLLPFGGLELYLLSVALLIALLFYNLHMYIKACKIR